MDDKFSMSVEENIFLAKKLLAESIYNTAKLEGVNTTFPETEAILEGVNVPGAKLDDIQVILNLRDAWRELLGSVQASAIDIEFIKKLNYNISRNESLKWGVLRDGSVGIAGTSHKPAVPDEEKVKNSINNIISDVTISSSEKAIDLMLFIMHSQLFWDGNKRTANLTANAVLIKNGCGILSISPDNIVEFNTLLKKYYDTNIKDELKEFLYSSAITDFNKADVPVNVPVNVTVNSNEEVVLNILKLNPQFTYEEIAIQIGKTRKTVSRIIANLKAQGMIKRRGSDKSGEWVVIKN